MKLNKFFLSKPTLTFLSHVENNFDVGQIKSMRLNKSAIINLIVTCSTILVLFIIGEIVVRIIEPPSSTFEFIVSRPKT